jgi:hypothetical protein
VSPEEIRSLSARTAAENAYDVAFVLRHNDEGGPDAAARAILERFPGELAGPVRTSLLELQGNFSSPGDQGPRAYASQMWENNRSLDRAMLRADAVVAVRTFVRALASEAGI